MLDSWEWHLQESAFLEGKGITEGLQWLMATLHGAPISSGLPKTKESPKDLDEVSTSAGSDCTGMCLYVDPLGPQKVVLSAEKSSSWEVLAAI
eukprot:g3192.t1